MYITLRLFLRCLPICSTPITAVEVGVPKLRNCLEIYTCLRQCPICTQHVYKLGHSLYTGATAWPLLTHWRCIYAWALYTGHVYISKQFPSLGTPTFTAVYFVYSQLVYSRLVYSRLVYSFFFTSDQSGMGMFSAWIKFHVKSVADRCKTRGNECEKRNTLASYTHMHKQAYLYSTVCTTKKYTLYTQHVQCRTCTIMSMTHTTLVDTNTSSRGLVTDSVTAGDSFFSVFWWQISCSLVCVRSWRVIMPTTYK